VEETAEELLALKAANKDPKDPKTPEELAYEDLLINVGKNPKTGKYYAIFKD